MYHQTGSSYVYSQAHFCQLFNKIKTYQELSEFPLTRSPYGPTLSCTSVITVYNHIIITLKLFHFFRTLYHVATTKHIGLIILLIFRVSDQFLCRYCNFPTWILRKARDIPAVTTFFQISLFLQWRTKLPSSLIVNLATPSGDDSPWPAISLTVLPFCVHWFGSQ